MAEQNYTRLADLLLTGVPAAKKAEHEQILKEVAKSAPAGTETPIVAPSPSEVAQEAGELRRGRTCTLRKTGERVTLLKSVGQLRSGMRVWEVVDRKGAKFLVTEKQLRTR